MKSIYRLNQSADLCLQRGNITLDFRYIRLLSGFYHKNSKSVRFFRFRFFYISCDEIFFRYVLSVSVIKLSKGIIVISDIAIACKTSSLIHGNISAISGIVKIVFQMIRYFKDSVFINIHSSQIVIIFDSRIDFITIEIFGEVNQIFYTSCIVADFHCRLKVFFFTFGKFFYF